jgi:adenylosuccinate lyase
MIPRYSRPEMAAIWADEYKFQRWLEVEIAAVQAWAEAGAVPREDAERIAADARIDIADINRYIAETHHDVTAFLRSVADSLGPESRWVHLGLTSSDVWDTATSLQLVAAADVLLAQLATLREVVGRRALEHKDTICVGRTHGVHAEPTTFGLKLAVWVDEIARHEERLRAARATVAVGQMSGPVGTHATVPPSVEEDACARLGLAVAPVTTQVIQRDRHAAYLSVLAGVGASLEKFATEIRGLQRTEILEAEEPFEAGQTGSSSMPHKRNPELCERVCGLARTLRGYAVTGLENVALWHERDISHSSTERIIFPDATGLLSYMLHIFTGVMDGLVVYSERMRANLERTQGLVFSQKVLLALIEAGMTREAAYKIVQRHSMVAWEQQTPLRGLLEADTEVTSRLDGKRLDAVFDYRAYLTHVDESFWRIGLLPR